MVKPDNLPAAAQAAYAELKRSLQASAILDLRGAPTRVQRGGKVYWYDSYRVGAAVRKAYLGEDSDELRAKLLQTRALAQAEEERKRERARLVRLLRAEGLLGVSGGAASLLAALSAAGAFRHGMTVVGTIAFRLYEGELGVKLDAADADADRITLALPVEPSKQLVDALAGFAFDPVPALRKKRTWRWRQGRGETYAAFVMPITGGEVAPRFIKAIGVYAQPSAGIEWLTTDPIAAAVPCRNGSLVMIPRPERYALHQSFAASRQEGEASGSVETGIRQSEALIAALASARLDDLTKARQAARSLELEQLPPVT